MNFNEYRKNQWDERHSRMGDPTNYVTDLSLNDLCYYHELAPMSNLDILDIGVGYGQLARELHARGNRLHCVDISSVALDRVKDISKTYLTEDIKYVPPVDLAISHLVFQHNHEGEILRILNDVNLKPDGTFTFQIATLDPHRSVLTSLVANDINNGMLFFYSPEKILKMISSTNKVLKRISAMWWHGDPFNFGWHIVQVGNRQQ